MRPCFASPQVVLSDFETISDVFWQFWTGIFDKFYIRMPYALSLRLRDRRKSLHSRKTDQKFTGWDLE